MTFRILESVTANWGDRPGLRTHQPARAARGDRNIPCHLHSYYHHSFLLSSPPSTPTLIPLVALQLLEEVAHLSAPLLSFPHLPSSPLSPSLSLFSFLPTPHYALILIWTHWPNWWSSDSDSGLYKGTMCVCVKATIGDRCRKLHSQPGGDSESTRLVRVSVLKDVLSSWIKTTCVFSRESWSLHSLAAWVSRRDIQ